MIDLKADILEINKGWLEDKIEKINKRARKIGVPELILTFGEVKERKYFEKPSDISEKIERFFETTLTGKIPTYNGWELIACFQREDQLVLIRTVPGKEVPIELRPTEISCEHCGYKRMRRKSFLLHSNLDGFKEVGSTCVKDFFGHDPSRVFDWATLDFGDLLNHASSDRSGMMANSAIIDLKPFLAMTAAVIEVDGWTSKTTAREDETRSATVWEVMEQCFPPFPIPKDFKKIRPTEKDVALAEETIEYFENHQDTDNDYIYSCKQVAELGYVPEWQSALACSMVWVILRQKMEVEERKARKPSEHLGEIKDRLTMKVTYIAKHGFEGSFGWTHIHTMRDEEDNVIKWFTGSNLNYKVPVFNDAGAQIGHGYEDYEIGDALWITGTVKAHDEYKGQKQTNLTRCIVHARDFDPTVKVTTKKTISNGIGFKIKVDDEFVTDYKTLSMGAEADAHLWRREATVIKYCKMVATKYNDKKVEVI